MFHWNIKGIMGVYNVACTHFGLAQYDITYQCSTTELYVTCSMHFLWQTAHFLSTTLPLNHELNHPGFAKSCATGSA